MSFYFFFTCHFISWLGKGHPFRYSYNVPQGFPVVLGVKNPPANAEDVKDLVSIPGSGRFSRGGHFNPLQYSCLENPMVLGAWQVHRAAQSWIWLKWLSTHTHAHGVSASRPCVLRVVYFPLPEFFSTSPVC